MKLFYLATATLLGSAAALPQTVNEGGLDAFGKRSGNEDNLQGRQIAYKFSGASSPGENTDLQGRQIAYKFSGASSPDENRDPLPKGSVVDKRQEEAQNPDDGGLFKRQGGGATLGTLLAATQKIVSQLGEEVPELEEPAKDLSSAIADFEDAAKDVDALPGSDSSRSVDDS